MHPVDLLHCLCPSHLPPVHAQIIAQTAKFVRGNGILVEVKLRVQQAGNPKFEFLNTQDRLYPYYRCVQGLVSAVDQVVSPVLHMCAS